MSLTYEEARELLAKATATPLLQVAEGEDVAPSGTENVTDIGLKPSDIKASCVELDAVLINGDGGFNTVPIVSLFVDQRELDAFKVNEGVDPVYDFIPAVEPVIEERVEEGRVLILPSGDNVIPLASLEADVLEKVTNVLTSLDEEN